MKYRADIDGLRAIAVTSVVLFHAKLPPLASGFVGVDVFFAISGYLIGGIIFREVAAGEFSLTKFYARRARRILPALLTVLLISAAAAAALLSPKELADAGREMIAASVGVSNVYYWKTINYFNPDAATNPLLMTWSLGVEEQFYVLFPLLLLLLARFRASMQLLAIAGLCVASFAVSVYATFAHPTAAFYSLPTRAWELGAGAMLAIAHATRSSGEIAPRRWSDFAALGGLLAVGFAIVGLDEQTPFPGWAALAPVLGTVLLIASPQAWINRVVLGSAPMVFVGKISYSWYLWHWPLMTFVRLSHTGDPPLAAMLGAAAVSFALAVMSWKFIETPFRHARLSPRRVLGAYLVVLLAWLAVPASFAASHGLPQRLPPSVSRIDAAQLERDSERCLAPYGVTKPRVDAGCYPGANGQSAWALMGDSHAAALGPGLQRLAAQRGHRLVWLTKASCPALKDASRLARLYPRHGDECARFNAEALRLVIADPTIETVVLAGFWSSGGEEGNGFYSDDTADGPSALALGLAGQLRALQRAGKRVVVVSDTPHLEFDPMRGLLKETIPARRALAMFTFDEDEVDSGSVAMDLVRPTTSYDDRARDVALAGGAFYQDLRGRLCQQGRCRIADPDMTPLYRDAQHLSRAGSVLAITPGLAGMEGRQATLVLRAPE